MVRELTELNIHNCRRVFVLVDDEIVRGVFPTWDAAESFADKNGFSLEFLMEFATNREYPDHLHLMSARWNDGWKFIGQWESRTPTWSTLPRLVRLDHYSYRRQTGFQFVREIVFKWTDDLLTRVNPMHPGQSLDIPKDPKDWPPPESWKHRITKPFQRERPRVLERKPLVEEQDLNRFTLHDHTR